MARYFSLSKLYRFSAYSAGASTFGLGGCPYLAIYNPNQNYMVTDSCVREVPITKLKPELVQDALNGGTRLVETFCGGMWGGYGYAIQREIMKRTRRDAENAGVELWEKDHLLHSNYNKGTGVTDHLSVLEKNPGSILMRGGSSPRNNPDHPGEMENLSELCVEIDHQRNVARFKMKNLFFQGKEKAEGSPFPAPVVWLHCQYCKLLVEGAVSHCIT